METNIASWLCESLGLPMLQEDGRGDFSANAAAWRALGSAGDDHPNLVTYVLRLCGGGIAREALEDALAQAREGKRQQLVDAHGRQVLIAADAEGRANVVVAPRGLQEQADLERRAASTDIAAGVSHELANALGAIAGWVRLARQGERVDEALELIEASADNAWAAARKVLGDLSRGEGGDDTVDLSGCVGEAARLLAPKAMAKGVRVETRIAPGLIIRGDRGTLWSIVWNLAINAVEALHEGGRLQLLLGPGTAGEAVLVVQDDGPGMSEQQRARAFEPYFTTKHSGTGLGLSMVKQAVDELGGEIELESERGKGARFRVTLPTARAASRRPNAKRSSGVFYAEPIDQRVLVVDDDAGLREMIATALSMRGAEVVCVPSSQRALEQHGPFALAVVDLLLPDIRGDELLARLRRAGIAQTGLLVTGTELPRELAEGGAPDAVLRKPFELEDLFDRLAELGNRSAEHSAAS